MTPLSATQGLSYQLSASRKTPTILIIPSLLHTPAHYGPLCWYFETQGYPSSFALLLPSSIRHESSNSSNGMAEDVASIRRVLEELVVKNEEEVVVVLHGYGAVPGCQAVTADLGREARVKMGKSGGGVTGLVLIGGWLVEEGESIEGTIRKLSKEDEDAEVEVRKSPPPPFLRFRKLTHTQTLLHPSPSLTTHFTDLPPQKAAYWTSKLQPPSPSSPASISTPRIQTLCWDSSIPTTYISCSKVPRARVTEAMLMAQMEKEKEKGGRRREWSIKTMEAGGAPFLSRVEEVGGVVLEVGRRGGVGMGMGGG